MPTTTLRTVTVAREASDTATYNEGPCSSSRTGAHGGQAFFAYSANYLIDLDHAVIVDVEASTAVRQAEVKAARP